MPPTDTLGGSHTEQSLFRIQKPRLYAYMSTMQPLPMKLPISIIDMERCQHNILPREKKFPPHKSQWRCSRMLTPQRCLGNPHLRWFLGPGHFLFDSFVCLVFTHMDMDSTLPTPHQMKTKPFAKHSAVRQFVRARAERAAGCFSVAPLSPAPSPTAGSSCYSGNLSCCGDGFEPLDSCCKVSSV